jgi:Na+-driven multidrug efflux pump
VSVAFLDLIVAGILGGISFVFARQILGIYSKEAEVISYGLEIMYMTTITYFICGFMDLIPGALRGMGYSSIPMLFSIIGTVGTRIVWIYLLFPYFRSLDFLFISYPVSWTVTVMMQLSYYILVRRKIKAKYGEGIT